MTEAALKYIDKDSQLEPTVGNSYLLNLFTTTHGVDRTGADIIEIGNLLSQSRSRENNYPLWEYAIDNVPLSAHVYFEEHYWFAEFAWLNVVGEGETPAEAIGDLGMHIRHFMIYYSQQDDDCLTHYAQELKNRYARITFTG